MKMTAEKIKAEILSYKKKRKAIILAHNYQPDEIQEIADFTGDSFGLSRTAARSDAEVIVFCGVHFMAESAALLAPEKTVLLPAKHAGCPLADTATAGALRAFKKKFPEAVVVTYVNTTAAVKAESDVCVTSSNAVKIVEALEAETIIFAPDKNLASFVAKKTGKNIIPWEGCCPTHNRITLKELEQARRNHPDAPVLVHPECPPAVVEGADLALSTGGILDFVARSKKKKFIIGTEMGILYRLKKENPQKECYLLSPKLICPNMKFTTLELVLAALEKMEPVITVPPALREKASIPLRRMLQEPLYTGREA